MRDPADEPKRQQLTGRRRLVAVLILSLVGVGISSYAVSLHYATGPSVCSVSDFINCDLVNRGRYSTIAGVPVAAIGIVGYVVLAVLASVHLNGRRLFRRDLAAAATLGFLYTLYLTYLELFVIRAICLVCVASAIVMTTIFLLVITANRRQNPLPFP